MTRAPSGLDLSFLNEEEARQIFQVLERDTRLKRTEKERISKLYKKKQEAPGLPGVTGEWFEDIQRRKFRNDTDVGTMLKQPLAHRLRKAIRNDSANVKPPTPQIPQAQKNGSPSLLGGLRTPFASLFSSFRKSKRQPPKPLQQQRQYPARYDHFVHTSSKVERMAKTETCNSPLTSEPTNNRFDANQAEMMEESTSTWNEHLENELLRVLGNLDDQLAREQAQDSVNRRTPTDYGSIAPDANQYPTVTRQAFLGGTQRNDRSMFLSDGTRTLRAKEDGRTFVRPRMLYDTYIKRYHAEDYASWDLYDRRSAALKRGHSTRSLGHSSEGSLGYSSGLHPSGFRHTGFPGTDIVSRSFSLSCLARRQSLESADQLSTAGLQHPLAMEGNRRVTHKNYCHHFKRTPLSSIVWNSPRSSKHPVYPDNLPRTQSLMEFGPTFEDTYPCSLQENTRYQLYRSKVNYRRTVLNANHSRGFNYTDNLTDPLCFDNRENYASPQLERKNWRPCYRYPSSHGRMNPSHKSFPCGRVEEQLFRPDGHQCYNDDVFFSSNANFERIPTNLNDRQSTYAKNIGLRQRESSVQNHASEYVRSVDHSEGIRARLFSKHAKGTQNCPMYNSTAAVPFVKASAANEPGASVSKSEMEYALQRQNLLLGTGQTHPKPLVAHIHTKQNFETLASEDGRSADPSGIVASGDTEERTSQHIYCQLDTNSPTESQVSPPKNASVTLPQASTSLKPPFLVSSERQTKSASIKEIEKTMYLSSLCNRNGQQNDASNNVDQTASQCTGNSTKASVLQSWRPSWQQEGHQSESVGAFTYNKTNENICSSDFDRGLEVLADDPCTEKFSKRNSFVRHATSKSVSGCTNHSPSKSPTIYYTLPRKSASIDGSVVSEKPISSPKRLFKNKITVGDNSDTLLSHRIGNIHSDQDKFSFEDPASSSLNLSLKNENIPQTNNYHLLTTQDPKHRSATDTIAGKSENRAVVCCPEKTESSVLSHSEETDAGNPLQQYKTTSTLTVSIEEDNVKYHELISVYYTLPRKHSRTLCNLFLDDTKNTESFPPSEKSEGSPNKYKVHVGIASVAFPSSLGKADPPSKMPATSGMPQNSKIADDADKESPIVEKAGSSQSQSTVCNREEALGPRTVPAFNQSSGVNIHDPKADPNPRVMVEKSVNVITNALGKLHIGACPSPLRERSKFDTPLILGSSNSIDPKISLENVAAASSALGAKNPQKESPLWCRPSIDATTSNKLHILPSRSIGNNQEGKYAANPAISSSINSTEDKTKPERARYTCHIISKKGNGLQPRNKSIGSGIDEASVSETKVCSDFQNQTLQMKAASSTVNVALQRNIPDKSGLEYPKTAQEETPKNSLNYELCTNLQRSMRKEDNQNLNSKDQLPSTKPDLSDCSATENKLILDCMKDKASDIEKRKNRSSIKNKLAAMYKTSRKFSTKKGVSPKPHISNIFSQNDAPSLETNEPHSMLISPDVPQALLQTGNENQNQNSLSERLDGLVLEQSKNKKLQTNEGPPLVSSENRRPFTNLCNQKREACRQSDKVSNNLQKLSAIFPKETISVLSNNSQAHDQSLENSNQSIFSRSTAGDLSQKRKHVSNVGDSSFFPLSSDNNSILIKNYSKANICPPQNVISTTEYVHDENKQSNRLRNVNVPCGGAIINPGKTQRERHFSERSYTQEPHDSPASGSNLIQHNSRYSRKFKSYSELLSCDENENWEAYNDSNSTFGSRRVMYPSIEFGIFGKEQQQAFLDNIKRSLTEGRLWSPCLLKNPGFLRKEEGCSPNASELLSSSSTEKNTLVEDSAPREPVEVHREDPVDCSNSDSDTTTDDEYYLDENDKESEL